MSLNNFFRINLPYGLMRNDKGEWMAFNREYRPIGINQDTYSFEKAFAGIPTYTKYSRLTDGFILEHLVGDKDAVRRDENGHIIKFFLYNDATNPTNDNRKSVRDELFTEYFKKLRFLSELKRDY